MAIVACAGCARAEQARQYQLRGQIIAIGGNPVVGGTEITIKHEDIPGFMPAMTMPYFLKKGERTEGIGPVRIPAHSMWRFFASNGGWRVRSW